MIGLIKRAKIFEKFDENWLEIRSIRFHSNYRVESNFQMLNLFEIHTIRKFAIRLIPKGKNIRKIRWKLIRTSFNSIPTIGWSQIFQMLDSFEIRLIWKFMIRLIRKVKNNSKNSIKINSKLVRFDLTPPLF